MEKKMSIILDGRPRTKTVDGTTWVYCGFRCGCYTISPKGMKGFDQYHPWFTYCPAHHMRAMRDKGKQNKNKKR